MANFAETEQLLSHCLPNECSKELQVIASFVQIRGSIPIFWSQPETWKLRPKIVTMGTLINHARALKSHLVDLYTAYTSPYLSLLGSDKVGSRLRPNIYFVNLIDKHGRQGILGRWLYAAFQHITTNPVTLLVGEDIQHENSSCLPLRVERNAGLFDAKETTTDDFSTEVRLSELFPTDSNQLAAISGRDTDRNAVKFSIFPCFIWFDYHHKCKKGNIDSLKEIYKSLTRYFKGSCFFQKNGDNVQTSVVRTNCIDCLDRTNVVQVFMKYIHLFYTILSFCTVALLMVYFLILLLDNHRSLDADPTTKGS